MLGRRNLQAISCRRSFKEKGGDLEPSQQKQLKTCAQQGARGFRAKESRDYSAIRASRVSGSSRASKSTYHQESILVRSEKTPPGILHGKKNHFQVVRRVAARCGDHCARRPARRRHLSGPTGKKLREKGFRGGGGGAEEIKREH